MLELRDLPTLNASLNGLAAIFMVVGVSLIHGRPNRLRAHKRCMLAAFGCSVLFLTSYLYYHAHAGRVSFQGEGLGRGLYFGILLSHTVLAAAVPFLAMRTIYLGLKDRRASHRLWAKWTFPIWLYVSITGVLIYLALYHWTDSAAVAFAQEVPK